VEETLDRVLRGIFILNEREVIWNVLGEMKNRLWTLEGMVGPELSVEALLQLAKF